MNICITRSYTKTAKIEINVVTATEMIVIVATEERSEVLIGVETHREDIAETKAMKETEDITETEALVEKTPMHIGESN